MSADMIVTRNGGTLECRCHPVCNNLQDSNIFMNHNGMYKFLFNIFAYLGRRDINNDAMDAWKKLRTDFKSLFFFILEPLVLS